MNLKFGGSDTRSLKTLASFPKGLFISELVDNQDPKIHQFLIDNYLARGAALFGRESPEAIQDFRETAGGSLDHISDPDVTGIIQFYVQRARNYGHIESLHSAMIGAAKVICIDSPRNNLCRSKRGRLLDIASAYNALKWFQTLAPEDYWREISTKDYCIPPFYRDCRCRLEGVIAGIN